ncbi:MAG: iron ABC transporter permease [Lachnospiraceae bacterium]
MEKNERTKKLRQRIMLLGALLFVVTIISILGGAVRLTFSDFAETFLTGGLTKAGRILLYVRLPRVAGGIIAGMALAVSGAVIQTVLNNPLAGPNIIGVNAGSGFAVVLCGALFPAAYAALPLVAFAGAFVTVLFVYYLGKKTGSSKITLVLAGVAINSLLNGASDVVYTVSESSLVASSAFKIGGLQGVTMQVLNYAGIVVFFSFLLVMLLHNELEVLSLGEEQARALGLSVSVYRFLFLALAAALAGAAVSFAGLLGFIGLIVPHIARMLVGGECIYLLPASALLGAALLTACDYIARTWFAPYELPVGILLSVLGAPFFLWLLCRKKGGNHA